MSVLREGLTYWVPLASRILVDDRASDFSCVIFLGARILGRSYGQHIYSPLDEDTSPDEPRPRFARPEHEYPIHRTRHISIEQCGTGHSAGSSTPPHTENAKCCIKNQIMPSRVWWFSRLGLGKYQLTTKQLERALHRSNENSAAVHISGHMSCMSTRIVWGV
eukprot:9375173-Pyramimonas_sp.AAC.1